MLCKLSISNIKRSFKDYTIYFVTLMLGVCIFYIFNSMDSQIVMKEVTSSQGNIIKFVEDAISKVSIFVAIVLGFLVIYASKFFIKKRNKEFGIYMTLGMSKRKMSIMLLLETFIIGLISLGGGLLLGIPLSQLTSVFVSNMFEVNMEKFVFGFSKAAMIKTIIYFGIIYIVVMVFNTIIINKNKLIDLMQEGKKQEKIKFKNTIISFFMFIISISMLVTAYYFMFIKPKEVIAPKQGRTLLPMIMIFLLLGTVMFFYSLAGIMLKILSNCHKFYCNKLNTFVFKQVSGKINTMVASISIICLMLFAILCLLPVSLTLKDHSNDSVKKYAPADFQLIEPADNFKRNDILHVNKFIESDEIIKNNTKDIVSVNIYTDEKLICKMLLGKYKNEINEVFGSTNGSMDIMGESDYNKMAKIFNLDTVELKDGECVVVANNPEYVNVYKKSLNEIGSVKIFDKDLKINKKVIDGFRQMNNDTDEEGFVVVKDSIVNKNDEYKSAQMLIGNYSTNDEKIIKYIENYIQKNTKADENYCITVDGITKLDLNENAIGGALTITFISIYIGIVFLISASAILALKGLSDCFDDKGKYKILRQIGADEKDINKALFKQTFIFFMMPFALATIHSIFGMKFCNYILNASGTHINIFSGVIATFAFLMVIYGVYFIITYICSKNIIKEKLKN